MAAELGSEDIKLAQIRGLLSTLEDPFEIFPLEAVATNLSAAVERCEESVTESAGWWGMSPKYRTVKDEHDIETIALLIGAAFVLGQVAIIQAAAIVRGVRHLAGQPTWLPENKVRIMALESLVHAQTGISRIALINAVANYFKHHHEWPIDWVGPEERHRHTIEMVRRLGLSPGGRGNLYTAENLYTAVSNLGFRTAEMRLLGNEIHTWREALAKHISRQLNLPELTRRDSELGSVKLPWERVLPAESTEST